MRDTPHTAQKINFSNEDFFNEFPCGFVHIEAVLNKNF